MSGLAQRRARLVRIRAIEHRAAAIRNAAAQRRVTELLGVASRIGDLRASLRPQLGLTEGQSLQAMAEMQLRLGSAERDLQQPIRQAEQREEESWLSRIAARSREDGAARLRDKAAAREHYAAAVREDANRPFRGPKRRRG